MLGIVIERTGGMRYDRLMSDLLWRPIGAAHAASVTVDALGASRAAGGLSLAAEDLLRIGLLLLNDGKVDGNRVIPKSWIDDMRTNGDDAAWANGNYRSFVEGGRYRSQWYQMPRGTDAFFAVGIHGQWLYVDVSTRTVAVKLASQSLPQDDGLDMQNLECLADLCASGD